MSSIKKTFRFFITITKKIYHLLLIYPVDNFFIGRRKKLHVTEVLFNGFFQKKNPYLCIFIHYDSKNELDKNCIHYLSSLKEAGCDIVLVSTSENLTEIALTEAKKYCCVVLRRSNVGRDIYSYKIGLEFFSKKIALYEKLILANDSVFGPLFDLKKLISFGDEKSLDFWGATDCYQIKYHLQSYFFVFTNQMAKSDCFKNYWKNVKLINYKRHLIEQYEVGITNHFMRNGYFCGAYCAYTDVFNQMPADTKEQKKKKSFFQNKQKNLTLHAWDTLIINHQFPFLKKELVRKNPTKNKKNDFQNVINKHAKNKITIS